MPSFAIRLAVLCGLVLALLTCGPAYAGHDATSLQAAVAAERARAPAPRFPRRAFLVRPTVGNVVLSPDGRHLAYLREHGDKRSLWLLDTAGGKPRLLAAHTDAGQVSWSHDGRWIFLASRRQVFAVAAAGQDGSGIVIQLGGDAQRELEAVDPLQPAALIVREHRPARPDKPGRWRLLRVGVHGKQTVLFTNADPITGYSFDTTGRLAYVARMHDTQELIEHVDASGHAHEVARCKDLHQCTLLPVTDSQGDLQMIGNVQGDLARLLRLDAHGEAHTLHIDPHGESDLDEVTLDPVSGQPLIASYRSIVATNYGLTSAATRRVAAITKRFPARNLAIQVGRGARARWLVSERASTLQEIRW